MDKVAKIVLQPKCEGLNELEDKIKALEAKLHEADSLMEEIQKMEVNVSVYPVQE